MKTAKKITIQIPEGLLKKAQKSTGSGITPTIRHSRNFENLSEHPHVNRHCAFAFGAHHERIDLEVG